MQRDDPVFPACGWRNWPGMLRQAGGIDECGSIRVSDGNDAKIGAASQADARNEQIGATGIDDGDGLDSHRSAQTIVDHVAEND